MSGCPEIPASVKEAQRAEIRERLRAQIDAEARSKADEDEVLSMVHHGVHKHQREERQKSLQLRQQRLDNAFEPKVCVRVVVAVAVVVVVSLVHT